MERLIYSNPFPSCKIHPKHHHIPSLPPQSSLRLTTTTHSKNFNSFFPPPSRLLHLSRLKPSSCSYHDHSSPPPSSNSNYASKGSLKSDSESLSSFSSADSQHGSSEIIQVLGKFVKALVGQRRKVVAAGTAILLSVILITVIHPIAVLPAFASFASPTSTGGPAAAGGQLLRSELLNSAWTGFFAGCLHTLSGPDHLAALAPLSIGRTRLESAVVGALWGCGHDAGQVIFGLLFLLLKDRLHIEIIRTWGTRVVGLTLMVIGAMGIREASEVPTPCVALENGECDVSVYEAGLENPTIGKKKIGFATFATGIVHGLQPDALIVILPALALPSRLAGAAFLFMFLVGTVIAMGSYTVLIGSCSQALKERIPRITEKLTWGSSLIAIALGFAIVISQFFGFSLY